MDRRLVPLLILIFSPAQHVCAAKSKWKDSEDPNRLPEGFTGHHTVSIHEAAKQGYADELLRHIAVHGRDVVHTKDRDVSTKLRDTASYAWLM